METSNLIGSLETIVIANKAFLPLINDERNTYIEGEISAYEGVLIALNNNTTSHLDATSGLQRTINKCIKRDGKNE